MVAVAGWPIIALRLRAGLLLGRAGNKRAGSASVPTGTSAAGGQIMTAHADIASAHPAAAPTELSGMRQSQKCWRQRSAIT